MSQIPKIFTVAVTHQVFQFYSTLVRRLVSLQAFSQTIVLWKGAEIRLICKNVDPLATMAFVKMSLFCDIEIFDTVLHHNASII